MFIFLDTFSWKLFDGIDLLFRLNIGSRMVVWNNYVFKTKLLVTRVLGIPYWQSDSLWYWHTSKFTGLIVADDVTDSTLIWNAQRFSCQFGVKIEEKLSNNSSSLEFWDEPLIWWHTINYTPFSRSMINYLFSNAYWCVHTILFFNFKWVRGHILSTW